MKARALLTVAALLTTIALAGACHAGAFIIWITGKGGPGTGGAVDSDGNYLTGTHAMGEPDLKNGALVQLWKAVGEIDDPEANAPAPWRDPDWHIDDVLLDQTHIGYGLYPPGAPANGEFCRLVTVNAVAGDVLYARVYNVPGGEVASTPFPAVGIRNTDGQIITHTVTDVMNPQVCFFGNLKAETASFFGFVSIAQPAPGTLQIAWTFSPGESYAVWSCVDLAAGPWTKEADIAPPPGQPATWSDPVPEGPRKFYRIEQK
jgi:hypothetical protein